MAGRILTLQRQARELGRLRSGYTDTSGAKPRPVRSETWILTSHNEDYVKAAATLWGGTPEKWQPLGAGAQQYRVITETNAIDALMPPGDPLSQTAEMWNKGGCVRRCDGITEQLTDSPCLCVAQFGSDFYMQPKDKRCNTTTRLSLILPQMPDVGVFRAETHGFYAANEIAATVDVIRSATGGNSLVPVSLRIEPRTRVSGGQTRQFPVIVLGLRGITAGQILSGTSPGLALNSNGSVDLRTGEITQAKAIEPAPSCDDLIHRTLNARTSQEVRDIWADATEAGCIDSEVTIEGVTKTMREVLTIVGRGFAEAESKLASADAPADRVAAWTAVLAAAAPRTTDEVLAELYRANGGKEPAECTAEELRMFGEMLGQTSTEDLIVAESALDSPEF